MPGCYVVFHKQLGDLVLLEPAVSRLRAHHGDPSYLLTRGGHLPVVELMGLRSAIGPQWRWKSAAYSYDPLNKTAVRALFLPALRKYAILPDLQEFHRQRRIAYSQIIAPGLGSEYVAKYFWENTPVPANGAFRPPKLSDPPAEWAVPGVSPRSYVLLNPTAGWPQKSWTGEGWEQTLKALHRDLRLPFLMTGSVTGWQLEDCRKIEALAGDIVRNISGQTTLKKYLWLVANARLVLTVDSAAAHLAAAFGVPNFTLFGPTDHRNWHWPSPLSDIACAPRGDDGLYLMQYLDATEVTPAVFDFCRRNGIF